MRIGGGVETRRARWKNPGLLLSGGAHGAMLVALLIHFNHPPEQQDQPETVQVDLVDDPSNQISQGEKTAKLDPTPTRRVDKVAEAEEHHPLPPTEQATKDTASLDAPDKANDDPGKGEKPVASAPPPPPPVPMPPEKPVEQPPEKAETAPTPPARPVEVAKAEPPKPEPRPEPAKAAPAKAEPAKPEPAKEEAKDEPDAEAMAPKPPPRPKTPPKEQPKPEAKEEQKEPAKDVPKDAPKPPHRPVKVAKVLPPKKPEVKPEPKPEPVAVPPRPEPKPEKPSLFDQVASLLKKNPEPPAPKPRTGNETKDAPRHDDFNPDKIAALVSHEDAQRRASTGRLVTKASLGLPTGHAEKLSPAMAAQIDNWLIDHYRGCWSYFGLGGTQDYVPQLRIAMAQDGTLIGQPALINPPKDPNLRSLADSAIRAVNRCNPMEIPARFRPYYDQGYKDRVVRFDPKEMS